MIMFEYYICIIYKIKNLFCFSESRRLRDFYFFVRIQNTVRDPLEHSWALLVTPIFFQFTRISLFFMVIIDAAYPI